MTWIPVESCDTNHARSPWVEIIPWASHELVRPAKGGSPVSLEPGEGVRNRSCFSKFEA